MPVNPGSLFAQEITASLALLVARWRTVLTPTQRDAWDALAFGTAPTGMNLYVQANTIRLAAGATVVDDAPATSGQGVCSLCTAFDADVSAQNFKVSFVNTDPWAVAVGGHLLIYASRPQALSINFFKGPYRLAGAVNGAVVPPTSPATITVPFPIALDQKLFVQLRSTDPDGRLSAIQRFGMVTIP